MNNDLWERVSDCVHPKHGTGVISRSLAFTPFTLKYEYQDGYSEYVHFDNKQRRKVSKYGFLKKETVA